MMSTFKSKSNSLESLVRTALLHGELAPGVAKQVDRYRQDLSSRNEKRLLAVLEDAIADGFVTVIKPVSNPIKQRVNPPICPQTVPHMISA